LKKHHISIGVESKVCGDDVTNIVMTMYMYAVLTYLLLLWYI